MPQESVILSGAQQTQNTRGLNNIVILSGAQRSQKTCNLNNIVILSGAQRSRRTCVSLLHSLFTCAALTLSLHAQTPAQLRAGFLNPPPEARPMVRWWWFGPAVTKPEILHELQQMKADGIGGAELAFVYPEALDDSTKDLKNLPFLSSPMLEAVNYAQSEGRRLGLRIDLTLCSGWPYGGPATTLAEAATRLRVVEIPIPAGQSALTPPTLAPGESIIAASIVRGEPSLPLAVRNRPGTLPESSWDPASAQPLTTPLAPAPNPRVALYFLLSHTRQQVKRAALGAEGYVLDPFSRAAVATHLRAVGEPLVKAFGANPPYAIFSDSLEAYGADWTPNLPEEFKKRRGYDLLPHLPSLAATGPATPAIERVRHDYGRTLTELVNENYLVQIDDWAKAHNTRFRSQTYGEPAVSFSSQRLVALPEGEGPQWRAFSTLRWATSANHVFGNNVTSGETYTWLHSPVFRATPLDMKAEADVDFITGENQLIFHGWPYSPPADKLTPGDPGWSLYAAAALNDHNPWHPVMPAVTAYITRLSWLLRQGQPANQVALLLPTDDAWASFVPGKVTVTGAMQKLVPKELQSAILSAGYNLDYIDADAIESTGLGTHQILVLPPTTRIPLKTLAALRTFQQHGGKVLIVGRAPSLDAEGNALPAGPSVGSLVASEAQLPGALHVAAAPDLTVDQGRSQLGFIRRKLPAGEDVYYIVNTSNQLITTKVSLSTDRRALSVLDPESGLFTSQAYSPQQVPLQLAPYESRIFLLDDHSSAPNHGAEPEVSFSPDISDGWNVRFTGDGRSTNNNLPRDWAADPETLHYSGEVVYSRDFSFGKTIPKSLSLQISGGTAISGDPTVPQENVKRGPDGMPNPLVTGTGPGMHAFYDPPIREAALVFLNGQQAGALWHPPYRLNIAKLLKPGINHIEIRVYNTALNAWSALPPRDYGPLKAKYGDRFQMQDLNQVKPLPSGILGKITLVQEPVQ